MRVLLVLMLAAASACRTPIPTSTDAVALAADRLTGSFSGAAQAGADPENYFDIRLHTVPI